MRDIAMRSLTIEHIERLKENGVTEGQHLDYKLHLPGGKDEDKKELLNDVCSFANAGGGDIIFGVEEAKDASGKNTGTIGSVPGLSGVNLDQEILRMESIIAAGLDPRVPPVAFQRIEGGTNGDVLVMRIRRSTVGPHLVKYAGGSRFFSRNSAGKFQLDVREIRSAMLESQLGAERARNFRLERIARILASETPVRLGEGPKWVLHIVPIRTEWRADVDLTTTNEMRSNFKPMRTSGWSHRYNLDGLIALAGMPSATESTTYALLFREGAVEAVEASLLGFYGDEKIIPSVAIEEYVVEHADRYVRLLRNSGIDAPLSVGLSFLSASGYKLGVSNRVSRIDDPRGFDRADIIIPETVVESDSITPDDLKSTFDILWQAAGYPRSLNFNDKGEWTPPR